MTETEKLKAIQDYVDKQACDEGLWFNAKTALEAYLQQELRDVFSDYLTWYLPRWDTREVIPWTVTY